MGADKGHRGHARGFESETAGPNRPASLLQEVRYAKSSGLSVRLMGGNTGPGVYKDWPLRNRFPGRNHKCVRLDWHRQQTGAHTTKRLCHQLFLLCVSCNPAKRCLMTTVNSVTVF